MKLSSLRVTILLALSVVVATPPLRAVPEPERESHLQAAVPYTPTPGSPERKAILDALRAEMRRFDPRPVVFVVRHFRVQHGWSWLEASPRSPDGRARYEDEGALLRRGEFRWEVMERMPSFGEREGSPQAEDCAYFAALQARFPAVPPGIFPPSGQRPCPLPGRDRPS
jgi:hypothetical protein